MSYVAPQLREKFEALSIGLKNRILEHDVSLHTLQDLIDALERIVREDKACSDVRKTKNREDA